MWTSGTKHEGERPGDGWFVHGWPSKRLWGVHLAGLADAVQALMAECTDRRHLPQPARTGIPHSPYGLDVEGVRATQG